jgi:hypothetical protein
MIIVAKCQGCGASFLPMIASTSIQGNSSEVMRTNLCDQCEWEQETFRSKWVEEDGEYVLKRTLDKYVPLTDEDFK